jgi:hypothetical protein
MKKQIFVLARFVFASSLVASIASSALARGEDYQTGFKRWRAADGGFEGWSMGAGAALTASGELTFDLATAGNKLSDPFTEGAYEGGNYYNAGEFYVGEATSPVMQTGFNFMEAIASWNANTPEGSWIEVQFRAQYGSRWSKWYVLGIWASGTTAIQRHSVRLQGDTDGFVATDTFVSSNKKETSNVFQVKMRLFSEDGTAIPTVRNASVAYSTTAPKKASASIPTAAPALLSLPECSQMVYPDGGEVWCSPTSMSMVLSFWNNYTGQCEPRVRAAVDGVDDWVYDGHGNWPFNTAYAATQVVTQDGATRNLEAYVARFTSLAKAEEYIAAGIPVVVSFAWKNGDLEGSAIPSSNGHLAVLVGFDAQGNPIINDPAASTNEGVQRTYRRSEFEPLWLTSSGGTVYLVYPEGHPAPSLY